MLRNPYAMNDLKQIGKSLAALVLFAALMLPTAIQFSHLIDGDDHFVCEERSSHFHSAEINCEICDFQLASFNYNILDCPDFTVLNTPLSAEVNLSVLRLNSYKKTNTQLRAPPIFS